MINQEEVSAMRKNDWILLGSVLAVATVFLIFQAVIPEKKEKIVEITVDGVLFGMYDLSEEQTIDIEGTNFLTIQDGKAQMSKADCPDKICVRHKAISKDGESIICLPNKVVVSIRGGEEAKADAVTN